MVFFDDDAGAPAPDPDADRRYAAMSSEQKAIAALEFEALCTHLVTRGIAFGQKREGFVQSCARFWDARVAQLKALRGAMEQAAAAIAAAKEAEAAVAAASAPPESKWGPGQCQVCGGLQLPCPIHEAHQHGADNKLIIGDFDGACTNCQANG